MTSFRRLKADEIQCRVATISENGVSLLLYKDARCDMNILDETVGCDMWQCRYYECKGNLYCSVGIKVGNEWIWKDNCGTESVTEKEKGEASDSFKRACFTWGIGRELYTSPYIWIPSEYVEIFTNGKGKKATNDKFIVSKMQAAEKDVPASVANKLQEMEYKWNKIADYKLARVLGDNLQKKEIYEDD